MPARGKSGARVPSDDHPTRLGSYPSGRGAPEIHASRLSFQPSASSEGPILRDLSFRVDAGALLLVAGSTGVGKSTLLRLIAGLAGTYPDPHASGVLEVRLPGEPSKSGPAPRLPEPRPGEVVLVPQAPRDALVSLDVFGALALPLEEQGLARGETRRRVEAALEHLGLLGKAQRDVARLSTGEARRVGLASALVQDAGLVLLDEPLADLDPLGVKTLREDLRSLPGKRTVVVAEHRHVFMKDLVNETVHLLKPDERRRPMRQWPLHSMPAVDRSTLRARRLSFSRGGQELLREADLDLDPGVWGLLGPNGAGKTTLLETVLGLLPPDRGQVETAGVGVWNGGRRVRPRRRSERLLRQRAQVAFQEPREAFFASTVEGELEAPLVARGLPRERAKKRVADALYAMGRQDLLGRSPQRLSGGEARLVQLLGVLLGGPQVLFLDEPTHGLDAGLRGDLMRLLDLLGSSGHLVVVATHEPGILPAQARWLFMPGNGRIVQGTQAVPGAPLPSRAGFDRLLVESTGDMETMRVDGLEMGVHA